MRQIQGAHYMCSWVPRGGGWDRKMFEEIVADNFPNMMKTMSPQFLEVQSTMAQETWRKLEQCHFKWEYKLIKVLWKTFGQPSFKVELMSILYDLAIPFLGMNPIEIHVHVHQEVRTQMFAAALFRKTKSLTQNREYRNEKEWICTRWMNLINILLIKRSQPPNSM